jgi:hypothetical protein
MSDDIYVIDNSTIDMLTIFLLYYLLAANKRKRDCLPASSSMKLNDSEDVLDTKFKQATIDVGILCVVNCCNPITSSF